VRTPVKVLLVCLCLCSAARVSIAEGNCPAGMYPITSPGVLGCAPIPVAQGEPVRTRRWASRWGAVAADEAGSGVHGVATGQLTQDAAESLARQRCQLGGGQKCSTFTVYANTCVYVAGPPSDTSAVAPVSLVAVAGSPDSGVQKMALAQCQQQNSRACIVAYTDCASPVPVDD
jgi:hypothetical protein